MSYQDAKRLGIERFWPAAAKSLEELYPAPKKPKPPADGMNKTERAFLERLHEAFQWFPLVFREPITLRLAGNTRYTPDFMTSNEDGIVLWEVKGFMRDDASVKIKVAAELFPFFSFVLVTRVKRRWECREVTSRGISREVFTPDWLK